MTGRLPLNQHERVAALLQGPVPWHTVEHLPEVGSTNDVILERARAGAGPGLVVVADHQTRGRGRAGRGWDDHSDPGRPRSLTFSCLAEVPDSGVGLVPLATGLAVADALRRTGASPALKWPNDVLVGEAKCAGILVERHDAGPGGAGPGDGDVLVIGIGIDLDWRDLDRGDDMGAWTSVAEAVGGDVDRGDVLADVLRGLAAWLRSIPTDPLRLLVAYRDACATIGREVRVDFPDGTRIRGSATDLDRDGRLVVDSPDTGAVAVTAGDVHHLRPA